MVLKVIPIHIKKSDISEDDDIVRLMMESKVGIESGDILVIAQKIISKQEGRVINLSTIIPSELALGIANAYEKNPSIVELILLESKRIVKMRDGVLIVETNQGPICANAGVDESNVQKGFATLLPIDPDRSAQRIHKQLRDKLDMHIPVLISDTFGRPLRNGQTDCAIGVAGIKPLLDYSGKTDGMQRVLQVTEIAIGDELCGAAELVMGKNHKCPMVIIRGYDIKYEEGKAKSLLRKTDQNLFV